MSDEYNIKKISEIDPGAMIKLGQSAQLIALKARMDFLLVHSAMESQKMRPDLTQIIAKYKAQKNARQKMENYPNLFLRESLSEIWIVAHHIPESVDDLTFIESECGHYGCHLPKDIMVQVLEGEGGSGGFAVLPPTPENPDENSSPEDPQKEDKGMDLLLV